MSDALGNIHIIIDVVTPIFILASVYVGLMIRVSLGEIRLTQEASKAELLAHQNEVKDDLTRHNAELKADGAELRQEIAVHVARDEEKFDAISRTLTRMDGKLDKLNGH